MDWKCIAAADPPDPDALTDLLLRAQAEIGGPALSGTRFLHGSRDMLAKSREIEASVLGTPTTLYAGFQNARRFDRAAEVYRDLVFAGTEVIAFGTGSPTSETGVRWVELPEDPDRLENQWYLITREPDPTAFVGFETPVDRAGTRGDGAAGARVWDGFVSHDGRLVDALVTHLDGVAGRYAPTGAPRE